MKFVLLILSVFAIPHCLADEGSVTFDAWASRDRHLAVVNPVCPADEGTVLRLRGEWDFRKSKPSTVGLLLRSDMDKEVRKVRVPGCWEASGIGEPGLPETYRCHDNAPRPLRHIWNGQGVYTRTVKVPPAWTNGSNRIWIAAGGIAAQGWISVNDIYNSNESAAGHYDAYCGAYKWEITDLMRGGDEARIIILADNTLPCRLGEHYESARFGGIFRDIELQVTPKVYIDDAWVRGDFDGHAAEVKVSVGGQEGSLGKLRLRATVEGETAEVPVSSSASAYSLKLALRAFRPWSPEHPNLYTAKVELVENGRVIQSRRERFGVRKFEVRGKEFYLNGRPFFFRGCGDNHPYPETIAPPADRAYYRANLEKLKAAGFNCIRFHTHAPVPEYFEAADEVGVLMQPELPYYFHGVEEPFEYNPLREARERRDAYRRHPSYAIASGGNEGFFGERTARALYDFQKRTDPDRLVIEQDGTWIRTCEGRGDYLSGPSVPWKRGAYNPCAFICHEYLNLSVKADSRDEGRYAKTEWLPILTREARAKWLAKFGLDHDWGDRFQDAAHVLQRIYQKIGIESARMDPYCDGYSFWTVTDSVVSNAEAGVFAMQGFLDPFWQPRRGGWSLSEFHAFNGPVAVCLDLTGNPASFPADAWDADAWFRPGGLYPDLATGGLIEDTNRVFTAGATLPLRFILSYTADADLPAASLVWSASGPDGAFARGEKGLGTLSAGSARTVLETSVTLPETKTPLKARIVAAVGPTTNGWDIWVMPRRTKRDGSHVYASGRARLALEGGFADLASDVGKAKVVVGLAESPEVKAALERGVATVELGRQDGEPNATLGWWWLGRQAGTAIRRHPALGDFPCGEALDQLFFRIVKTGAALPVEDVQGEDLVIAGEGVDACYVYLAVTTVPTGSLRVRVFGLDLLSPTPEGAALLDRLVDFAGRADRLPARDRTVRRARPAGERWYKGMLHGHSYWSDGDAFPEQMVDAYRRLGYDFISLTDHNRLSMDREGWRTVEKTGGGWPPRVTQAGFDRAKGQFPWLRSRVNAEGRTEVRLTPYAELLERFNEPGRFLLIPGFEATRSTGDWPTGRWVHMNAIGVREVIPSARYSSIIQFVFNEHTPANLIRATREECELLAKDEGGQPFLFTVNHPYSRGFELMPSDLIANPEVRFFEVCNNGEALPGYPEFERFGGFGNDRFWDVVNAFRARAGEPLLYGTAVDDTHSCALTGATAPGSCADSFTGDGYIRVRSKSLTWEALLEAMNRGDFYASCGVDLEDVSFDGRTLRVCVPADEESAYRVRFIVTKRGFDDRVVRTVKIDRSVGDVKYVQEIPLHSDEIGQVVRTVAGERGRALEASYDLADDDLYVRARIEGDRLSPWATWQKPDAPRPLQHPWFATAWTQPYVPLK